VLSYTNRRSQTTAFTYDSLSRVTLRVAGSDSTVWKYDPNQQWTAVRNGQSVDTLFATAGDASSFAAVWRNGNRFTIGNSSTPTGKQAQRDVSAGGTGASTNYVLDDAFRLKQLTNTAAKRATLKYNGEGLLDTLTIPTSGSLSTDARQTWTHFASHGVSSTAWSNSALATRSYTIDNLDRVITQTLGTYPYNIQRSLGYDALGRLRVYADSAWTENAEHICPTIEITDCYWAYTYSQYQIRRDTFAFDGVGNPTNHSASVGTGNRLDAYNGFDLTYDADGNMLTKIGNGVRDSLSWDVLGQLTRLSHTVSGVTKVTTFAYDGMGRRATKVYDGTTTRYLWDGADLVTELDGSGNRLRDYAYLPGIDQPQSMVRHSDGASFYYAMEEPGHVAGVMNSSGTLVASYEYTPFGQRISATESLVQPLQFMGRERDEAGYYFVRARYYDPDLGRFISEDPIGLAGGINSFAYTENDPVNLRDPSGLDAEPIYITACEGSKRYNWRFECVDVSSGDNQHASLRGGKLNFSQFASGVADRVEPWQGPLELAGDVEMFAANASLAVGFRAARIISKYGSAARQIGAFPKYIEVAKAMGRKYFDLGKSADRYLPTFTRWANNAWTNWGIRDGADFYVAYGKNVGEGLARELGRLEASGQYVMDGARNYIGVGWRMLGR